MITQLVSYSASWISMYYYLAISTIFVMKHAARIWCKGSKIVAQDSKSKKLHNCLVAVLKNSLDFKGGKFGDHIFELLFLKNYLQHGDLLE